MSCEACRTIPPVTPDGYTPQGQYETIAGLNTYVTGNTNSEAGLVDVYDIFGLSNQTLQGADLLAVRLNAVVLVPDFFNGDSLSHDCIPPDTQEKKQMIRDFLANQANVTRNADLLTAAVGQYRARFPSVRNWGTFGLCWGGKVAALVSGLNTPFVASGQVHPGLLDPADASALTIPHVVLASKDESADAVAAYADIITNNGKGGLVETYPTMWHGWMGARADLAAEESRTEYLRGYNQLADFFEKHLS